MASTQTTQTKMQSTENVQQNKQQSSKVNVSTPERWASLIGGSALLLFGVARDMSNGKLSIIGITSALLGGGFVYRGATRHCYVYQALGINSADKNQQSIHIEKVMTINRPLENFAHFQQDFDSTDQGPAARTTLQEMPKTWDAWRTLKDTVAAYGGQVSFEQAPDGRGTEVRISLSYTPPVGKVGNTVNKLLGKSPKRQITEDLRHFKAMMEAGEVPTTDGQPVGQ